MTAAQSTRARSRTKPKKPYPNFPLFPHASGQWSKKVRGKLHYFGVWSDPQSALELWRQQEHDLRAGRTPRQRTDDGLPLHVACNKFLAAKKRLVESGERTERHWQDLYRACELVVAEWGRDRIVEDISPEDFGELRAKMAGKWKSPKSLKREMANVRQIFNFASKNQLVDRSVAMGTEFSPPSNKALRMQKQKAGSRMLDPAELQLLIDDAGVHFRAMILLALNTSCGNTDVAFLTFDDIDLDTGWLDMHRSKTAEHRRAKLWPETVEALRESIDNRRRRAKLRQNDNLVFLTKSGNPWGSRTTRDSAIAKRYRRLLDKHGLYRPGRSFYSLRHVFQTVAEDTLDIQAVRRVMGHVDNSISNEYRDSIPDERIEKVCNHVRRWLFGRTAK